MPRELIALILISAICLAVAQIIRARRHIPDDDERLTKQPGLGQLSECWVCSDCGERFETIDEPAVCPCCGSRLATMPRGDGEIRLCPSCGPYAVIRNGIPDNGRCPVCGKPSIRTAAARRLPARWECTRCGLEFTTQDDRQPRICPSCHAVFGQHGILKETPRSHACFRCGSIFQTADEHPARCPYCGKSLDPARKTTKKGKTGI